MTQDWKSWGRQFGLVRILAMSGAITLTGCFAITLTGCFAIALSQNPASAQIIPDASLGTERSVVIPDANVRTLPAELIEGGALRGTNLFHSFQEFNVGNGQRVYFANPAGIENILSRVTGNNLSKIFGTLGVNGGANLFLLNPNGIIFGPNARLDIAGSFMGSTANSLVFGNGLTFSAKNPQGSPLLTISLTPGLQYGATDRGAITNAGNLAVGAGETLTLQGGTVTNTGSLTAKGGKVQVLGDRIGLFENARIEVSGETSGGTVLIGGDFQGKGNVPNATRTFIGSGVSINADAVSNGNGGRVIVWSNEATYFYGNISARGGANAGNGGFVEVSGKQFLDYNGLVDTRAPKGLTGNLLLDPTNIVVVASGGDTSKLSDVNAFGNPDLGTSGTQLNVAAINNATANVILQASNDITFNANVNILKSGVGLTAQASNNIVVNSPITTQGGAIQLIANDASSGVASGTGSIFINANIQSLGGAIALRAGGDISVNGASLLTASTLGNSGNLSIETARLLVRDRAQVRTAASSGRAGNLIIQATESVNVLNRGVLNATAKGTGAGGNISIATRNLTLQDGFVGTNAERGNAGSVAIRSLESVTIAGGGFISTGTSGSGAGGNVLIETGTLTINDQGIILTSTYGPRNSGNLILQATNAVNVTGNGSLSTGNLGTGAGGTMEIETGQLLVQDQAEVSTFGTTGNAGNLTIHTGQLQVRDGATVYTSSEKGNAGKLSVQATDFVNLLDGGALLAISTATGSGGTIAIDTRNLILQNGGQIGTTTIDRGNAGNITINSSESVTVSGSKSAISALSFGSGTGGSLSINTGTLTIRDGGSAVTSTASQGNAGNLTVNAANAVNVVESGVLSTGTIGTGAGGNLSIATRNLNIQNSGKVFTSSLDASTFDFSIVDPKLYPPDGIDRIRNSVKAAAQGNFTQGNSGNLTVSATDSVNVSDSGILSTQGRGRASGGNLSIDTQKVNVQSQGTISTETSGSGNAGSLTINAPASVEVANSGSNITSQALPGSMGNGGRLAIATGQLGIQDSAAVSSATFGQGLGGDVQLQANSISLTDSGRITSRSEGSSNAGNIAINLRDTLQSSAGEIVATATQAGGGKVEITASDIRLRNSSLISSSVFDSTGGGGNININSKIFLALEDSDILANAVDGRGGNITIKSPVFLADIFTDGKAEAVGRNPGDFSRFRGNDRVDISAEATGSGTSGTVILPTIDLTRGLTQLPSDLVDAEGLIDRRCSPGGAAQQSSFTVTGRGGLPPSPNEPLRGDAVTAEWISINSEREKRDRPNPTPNPTSTTPNQLVEAQGWVIGSNGQVILTAQAPTVIPQNPGLTFPSCQGSQATTQ